MSRPPAPVVIEFAGTPGSGKTTVARHAADLLRAMGRTPATPVQLARDLAARGLVGRLAAAAPDRLRRRLLWAVYLVESTVAGVWSVLRRPALAATLLAQRRRPATSMTRRRGVVRWFLRHAGTERLFRRRAIEGEVLLADEGYLHRAVQLFASETERGVKDQLQRYVSAIPVPDLVVVVDTPVELCLERIEGRGVWDRWQGRPDALRSFLENAEATLVVTTAAAHDAGIDAVRVDNTGGEDQTATRLGHLLEAGLADRSWRFRPRWAAPRVGTIVHAARLPGPAAGGPDLDRILETLGRRRTGRARRFSTGRRSAILGVRTDRGKVVVKRYGDHWSRDSVRHEHAVLDRLATARFPSVRLLASPGGETVFELNGHVYAAFDFVDGRSFAGRRLPDGRIADLFTDLGVLLAMLHDELEGHEPPHRHHLGVDPESGDRMKDLSWQIEQLQDLRRRNADGLPDAGRWMADRAGDLEERLVEVDARLRATAPRVTIIHGDFGPHNVLVTGSGPVLHDFELARTDWRLTDVVMLLSRLRSPVAKRSFVESYQVAASVSEDEWAALDDVWLHHTLTGAIQAWNTYLRRGDPSRLGLARRRAEQAVAAGGAARWL